VRLAEFEGGISPEAIADLHADALDWLRYVDPEKLRAALERIFEAHPTEYVAPIHGHPVVGADVERFTDRLVGAAAAIAAEHTVPDPDR